MGVAVNCPVCGAPAKKVSSAETDGIVIRCSRCGNYGILSKAFDAFLRLGFDQRVEALKTAKKSASGSMPVITRAPKASQSRPHHDGWVRVGGWVLHRQLGACGRRH